MTEQNQILDPSRSEQLWNQIVADFRQICVLRREGREEEAAQLVNETMPRNVARWSRADSRPSAAKKAALEAMFATEQRFVDSALFAQRALATRLVGALVPEVCRQVGRELRQTVTEQLQTMIHPPEPVREYGREYGWTPSPRQSCARVRFDDVPGVIDAVLSDQVGCGRRHSLVD